jgi:hypothetical protein
MAWWWNQSRNNFRVGDNPGVRGWWLEWKCQVLSPKLGNAHHGHVKRRSIAPEAMSAHSVLQSLNPSSQINYKRRQLCERGGLPALLRA